MNETIAGNKIQDIAQIDVSLFNEYFCYIHEKFILLPVIKNFIRFSTVNFHFHSFHQQLELISLQFLHQKPKFSACGFFSIDMTFVYAVS